MTLFTPRPMQQDINLSKYWDTMAKHCHPNAVIVYLATIWPQDQTTAQLKSFGFDILRFPAVLPWIPAVKSLWPEKFSVERLLYIKQNVAENLWRSYFLCEDVT